MRRLNLKQHPFLKLSIVISGLVIWPLLTRAQVQVSPEALNAIMTLHRHADSMRPEDQVATIMKWARLNPTGSVDRKFFVESLLLSRFADAQAALGAWFERNLRVSNAEHAKIKYATMNTLEMLKVLPEANADLTQKFFHQSISLCLEMMKGSLRAEALPQWQNLLTEWRDHFDPEAPSILTPNLLDLWEFMARTAAVTGHPEIQVELKLLFALAEPSGRTEFVLKAVRDFNTFSENLGVPFSEDYRDTRAGFLASTEWPIKNSKAREINEIYERLTMPFTHKASNEAYVLNRVGFTASVLRAVRCNSLF